MARTLVRPAAVHIFSGARCPQEQRSEPDRSQRRVGGHRHVAGSLAASSDCGGLVLDRQARLRVAVNSVGTLAGCRK